MLTKYIVHQRRWWFEAGSLAFEPGKSLILHADQIDGGLHQPPLQKRRIMLILLHEPYLGLLLLSDVMQSLDFKEGVKYLRPALIDGREDIVDLLRFIVILPERDIDGLRPVESLASNDEVVGLYRARV